MRFFQQFFRGRQQMHRMSIMDAKLGDREVTWDPKDTEQVGRARKEFQDAIAAGYWAYETNDGATGSKIKDFNPDAERIVMNPQLVGG